MKRNIEHSWTELPPGAEELSRIRVLVVDDDVSIGKIIQHSLHNMGIHHVQREDNSVHALEGFMTSPNLYDMIICDWMMPDVTGLMFLKKVRAITPFMPFIMLTAKVTPHDVRTAQEAGVSAYIGKPFPVMELQKKIRSLLMDTGVIKKPRGQNRGLTQNISA